MNIKEPLEQNTKKKKNSIPYNDATSSNDDFVHIYNTWNQN